MKLEFSFLLAILPALCDAMNVTDGVVSEGKKEELANILSNFYCESQDIFVDRCEDLDDQINYFTQALQVKECALRCENLVDQCKQLCKQCKDLGNQCKGLVYQCKGFICQHKEQVLPCEDLIDQCKELINQHKEMDNKNRELVDQRKELVNQQKVLIPPCEKFVNRYSEIVNKYKVLVDHRKGLIDQQKKEINQCRDLRIAVMHLVKELRYKAQGNKSWSAITCKLKELEKKSPSDYSLPWQKIYELQKK